MFCLGSCIQPNIFIGFVRSRQYMLNPNSGYIRAIHQFGTVVLPKPVNILAIFLYPVLLYVGIKSDHHYRVFLTFHQIQFYKPMLKSCMISLPKFSSDEYYFQYLPFGLLGGLSNNHCRM